MMRAMGISGLAVALATVGCGDDIIDANQVVAGIEHSADGTIDESSVSG